MPLCLLHLSDIHFGGQNAEALAAADAFVRARPFDLLVVSGDFTQFGHHDEFVAAEAWLSDLPGPLLATPGNHDTPYLGIGERVTAPFNRYRAAIGPAGGSTFVSRGLVASAFNSARGWQVRLNWSKGAVSPGQTRRAVADLSGGAAEAIRVAVCHHPLIEVPGGPMTARVRGGARAAEALVAAGADLILTGHLHAPFVQPLPFGDRLTYAVGAGTLSLRERGVPAGFNMIEIEGQTLLVTALGWTGQGLEVQQVWEEPLRPRGLAS